MTLNWVPPAARTALLLCRIALHLASLASSLDAARDRGEDWPTARHDHRNTAYNREEVAPPLRASWRKRLGDGELNSPLSSGGVVCVGRSDSGAGPRYTETWLLDHRGRTVWRIGNSLLLYVKNDTLVVRADTATGSAIRCFEWRKRHEKWSYPLDAIPKTLGSYAANVDNGRLYYGYSSNSQHSVLLALDLIDGSVVASREMEEGWWSGPPAIDSGRVYWGISHSMHVLDADTLNPIEAIYDGGNAYPVPISDRLLTRGWSHGVRAVRLSSVNRETQWAYGAWRESPYCLARGAGDSFVLVDSATDPPSTAGIDPLSGRVIWRDTRHLSTYGDQHGTAGSGRFAYVCARNAMAAYNNRRVGGFYCVLASNGRIVWQYERENFEARSVIVSEGKVFGTGSDGFLYCFEPRHLTVRRKVSRR